MKQGLTGLDTVYEKHKQLDVEGASVFEGGGGGAEGFVRAAASDFQAFGSHHKKITPTKMSEAKKIFFFPHRMGV